MAQGAFNVSRLIAELGLQQLTGEELRVLETIQPVLSVGDISGNSPPHQAPAAMFGGIALGAGANFGTVQLQCLAPGGLFVDWFTLVTPTTTVRLSVRPGAPSAGMPVLAAAGQLSRDPVVSIVTNGNAAVIAAPVCTFEQTTTQFNYGPQPLFVPRGTSLTFQATTVGVQIFTFNFAIREVPASEHVPS